MNPISPRTPVDDFERIGVEFKAIKDRLDELEAPSGTSVYRTVSKLTALIDDIQGQLDAWAAGRRTDAATDTIIDAKIAAAIATMLAGTVSIGGGLSVGGTLYAAGKVTLPGVYALNVVAAGRPRITAWVDSAGELGHT